MPDATRVKDPIPTALTLLGVDLKSRKRPSEREFREQIGRARAYVETTAKALLPIEKPATLRALNLQIAALEGESLGFQRVPVDKLREVLAWRNADGFPTIAPFSVNHEQFAFAIHPWGRRPSMKPQLPVPLRSCYSDVFALLLKRQGQRNVIVRASVTFSGVIPDDVRRVLVAAKPRFKDIRVLAEVDRWKVKETEVPALNTDPLVIGYDGEEFWLLAAFDITPLEEAVRQICLGKAPEKVS